MNPYTNIKTTKTTLNKINTLKKYFGLEQSAVIEYITDMFIEHVNKCKDRHSGDFVPQMYVRHPDNYFCDKPRENVRKN
jgi:hypothetical protein